MTKIKYDFSTILNNYFTKHLSLERKFSLNTYKSYLIVLKQYIHFLETIGVKRCNVSIDNFDKESILEFLNYVEQKLHCSVKTRNHKLTIINSFLEYAQSVNPIYINIFLGSKSIKLKRVDKEKMDFMTVDELEVFFSVINIKRKNEYKHYVLFTVLYETGARVSELVNLKLSDVFITSSNQYVKILGKGNKERLIYLNKNTVEILQEYIEQFKIVNGYLFLNNSLEQYSRFGINKLTKKYFDLAKQKSKTLINKKITPHSFRHSKAVHFLLNGTALPIIQRFLGHSSIQSTEIYLDITNEVVVEAVNLAASLINKGEKEKRLWEGEEDLLSLLESLNK